MTILVIVCLVLGCSGILTTLLTRNWIAALWATAYTVSQLSLFVNS